MEVNIETGMTTAETFYRVHFLGSTMNDEHKKPAPVYLTVFLYRLRGLFTLFETRPINYLCCWNLEMRQKCVS